ncbi:MAG: hypothetical protein QS98_C0004G0007 [archaeon GW2011_AR3]|nr:MAG: hypothetical protein QS98_C0004G0007 [archaeon GW2011_AR3]MBS3109561.1 sulfite exporter TauE/SafE family protein [Candidatus Woesearchaeota archaeon]
MTKKNYQIKGMHCHACEVLIERNFKKIDGVEIVEADYTTGRVELQYNKEPSLKKLNDSIKKHGYSISPASEKRPLYQDEKPNYFEIFMYLLVLIAVYVILQPFGLIPDLSLTDNMGYGFIFMLGIVAAFSTCLAVSGGLLLAVAAKYNEMHPGLSRWQRFKPNIYFNVGRILSYTMFGFIIGGFGAALTLSPRGSGILTIIVSIVMLLLGFQLLNLFPGLRKFQPKMPKFLGHRVHDLTSMESNTAPFLLGAGTFFLPCGFTMALQLYVLTKGSAYVGAMTMLVFSLGTMPTLASLGAITSYVKGEFQKGFLKLAGVAVILMALFNIVGGISLVGLEAGIFSPAGNFLSTPGSWKAAELGKVALGSQGGNAQLQLAPLVDGKQVARMKVDGLEYEPANFRVRQGVPVEWQIDASDASGCAHVLIMPKMKISTYLSGDKMNIITFTPAEAGNYPFSCSMGMTTRGASFEVVSNTQELKAAS